MKRTRTKQDGLIGLIIILIVALIVLGYFGFNVRNIVESPQVQENLLYVWNGVRTVVGEIWGIAVGLYHSFISFIKELSGKN